METRVAVISIIVEDIEAAESINILLHQYRQYVIGRMGVPHTPKKDFYNKRSGRRPMDAISALSGKLGSYRGSQYQDHIFKK